MLHSMTGYGKTEVSLADKKITVEIKSLNSKNIDTNLKVPNIYREKELIIRNLIHNELKRGKIEFNIHYELNEGVNPTEINQKVFKNYYKQLIELKKELGIEKADLLSTIMRLPDTLLIEKSELNEEDWLKIEAGIIDALSQVNEFRKQEGLSMQEDLLLRSKNILELKDSLLPFETRRIEKLKERIFKSMEEFLPSEKIDKNRFEQEMIFYIEKLDISEEKVRLLNHCQYFNETIEKDPEPGKKLAFISQEIGREINTIGSKANDSDMQHIVVKMKDELEKIKELTLNIL
ncbi:MAG: YicC family protein [Bacteroidales bacterium]|nr:YicC family protein [Bacteroidales bacterium]MCF8390139.1 YicC family protein [Bacteroidales bacterium]